MPPVAPLPRLLSPPAALRDGKIRQGLRPLFPIRIKATGPQRRPRILPGGFLHNHAQKRLFRRHAACSALLQGRRHGKSRRQRFFPPPQQAENAAFPRPSSLQGRTWPSGGFRPPGALPFFPAGADMALRRLRPPRAVPFFPSRGGHARRHAVSNVCH